MKYKRKPKVVEALRFLGTDTDVYELRNFLGKRVTLLYEDPLVPKVVLDEDMQIVAPKGYYILKDNLGRVSVMEPYEFESTYERIDN